MPEFGVLRPAKRNGTCFRGTCKLIIIAVPGYHRIPSKTTSTATLHTSEVLFFQEFVFPQEPLKLRHNHTNSRLSFVSSRDDRKHLTEVDAGDAGNDMEQNTRLPPKTDVWNPSSLL